MLIVPDASGAQALWGRLAREALGRSSVRVCRQRQDALPCACVLSTGAQKCVLHGCGGPKLRFQALPEQSHTTSGRPQVLPTRTYASNLEACALSFVQQWLSGGRVGSARGMPQAPQWARGCEQECRERPKKPKCRDYTKTHMILNVLFDQSFR